MLDYIDKLLKTDNREMTYHNDLIMCGSTGNRVYGSFSREPGLCGIFHFVHKSDFVDLIKLDFREIVCPLKLRTTYEWMPSHIHMKHFYPGFVIEENKYITEDDLIVSWICIRSVLGNIKFKLGLKSKVLNSDFENNLELFNQSIDIKTFCSDNELFGYKDIELKEDKEFCFAVACGFKVKKEQWTSYVPSLEQHKAEYGRFYKEIPKLTCSDKEFEKVYYYRWFLLKHNIANPQLGNISYPIFYEGRYGYFKETGLNSDDVIEWEFSKGILASVSHHLLDMRWHNSSDIIKGEIQNYTLNFGKMDTFLGYRYDIPLLPGCIRIHDCVGHYFFHLLPYAVWQIYESIKDKDWLKSIAPALWADLCGWSRYDLKVSGLPLMIYEGDSAMEFGPASHHHCKEAISSRLNSNEGKSIEVGLNCNYETEEALWGSPISNCRTEVATFYGLNHYAFHKIFSALGDIGRAEYCLNKYSQTKNAVSKYMWDEKEKFFLELTEDLKHIKGVKQIGGIFCLLLANPENPQGFLDNLQDKEVFNQEFGIASTSKDSFGYFPNNTVNGVRAHTCMWNGPAWPYSISFALMAVGNYIKRIENIELKAKYIHYFKNEFEKYNRMHFLSRNTEIPCIVEHYDSETGLPLSGQDDYNHSSYIDIFIRHVCGLDIDDNGGVNFSPIDMGFEYLKIEDINFKGSCYKVEIQDGSALLYKDGKLKKIISSRDGNEAYSDNE